MIATLVIAGMLIATAAIFAQQMTSPAFAASSAAAGSASSTDGTAAAGSESRADPTDGTLSSGSGAAGGTESAGGAFAMCPHSSAVFGAACTGSP
jgi:hypothetical protein